MRGWALCLIGPVFVLAGCTAQEPAVPPSSEPQTSTTECPTGECCEIKGRAAILKKSLENKEAAQTNRQ